LADDVFVNVTGGSDGGAVHIAFETVDGSYHIVRCQFSFNKAGRGLLDVVEIISFLFFFF
jgi:hypothetical protein